MITKKITITLLFSLTPLISLGMNPDDDKPAASLLTCRGSGFSMGPTQVGDPLELFARMVRQRSALQDFGAGLSERISDLMTDMYKQINHDIVNHPDSTSCKYLSKYRFYSHNQDALLQENDAIVNSSIFAALEEKWQEKAKTLKEKQDEHEERIYHLLRYKNERTKAAMQEVQTLLQQVRNENLAHFTTLFAIACMNNMKYVDWQQHLAKLSGEIEESK